MLLTQSHLSAAQANCPQRAPQSLCVCFEYKPCPAARAEGHHRKAQALSDPEQVSDSLCDAVIVPKIGGGDTPPVKLCGDVFQ